MKEKIENVIALTLATVVIFAPFIGFGASMFYLLFN